MKINVQLDPHDLLTISKKVHENKPMENREFEVCISLGDYRLCLTIDYNYDVDVDKGDYYTPPFGEITEEYFEITDYMLYTEDGCPIDCGIDFYELKNIL